MRFVWFELLFKDEGEGQADDAGGGKERGLGHVVPEIFIEAGVEIDAEKDDTKAGKAAVFQAGAGDDLGNAAEGEQKDP